MKCLLSNKCWDSGSPMCATCIHNEEKSYYVPYHEYPPSKWPEQCWPFKIEDYPQPLLPSITEGGNTTLKTITTWRPNVTAI